MSAPWPIDLQAPCVEPRKRLVGGKFGWAIHRFPIKGGISLQRAMSQSLAENLVRPNALNRMLLQVALSTPTRR
jgi:hypothetical protein